MGHFCSPGGGKKGHFSTFRVGQGGRWLGGGVLGARGGAIAPNAPFGSHATDIDHVCLPKSITFINIFSFSVLSPSQMSYNINH